MGIDVIGHIDAEQDWFQQFTRQQCWYEEDMVANKYADEHDLKHLNIAYSYNDDIHLHTIWCMTPASMFGDEQFTNPMYIRALEKKHGQEFPIVLNGVNLAIHKLNEF